MQKESAESPFSPPQEHGSEARDNSLRDIIALSTLPAIWIGAAPLRIAQSLAASLFTILAPEFVYVSLVTNTSTSPITIIQSGQYKTDQGLADHLGPEIADWARTHDPDELLPLKIPGRPEPLRLTTRQIGLNGELGVIAAAFGPAWKASSSDLLLLNVAATQAAIAIQNANLVQALRESERESKDNLRLAQENEALAQIALDNSPDFTMLVDLDGRLLTLNPSALEQLKQGEATTRQGSRWIDLWAEKDRAHAEESLEAALKGHGAQFQAGITRSGGGPKWWDVLLSPVKAPDGKLVKLLCVARDVTLQRRIDEEFRATAKLESLGILAGGIAHDFNNLLTGVLGNASLLVDMASEAMRPFAEQIVSAAERAAHLTQQMLAYSGKGRFQNASINLSLEIRELLPLIKPSLGKTPLSLRLDDGIPDMIGDIGQIQQVIMNLAINAAEAMEGKGGLVVISTGCTEIDEAYLAATFSSTAIKPGSFVWFEVHDTGIGMDSNTQAKMFDPFFTTKFTGRGLGLAAVSGIVRGHGGAMRVYSVLGEGTTFKVLFPAAFSKSSSVITEEKPAEPTKGTILFVDDEEVVRRIGKSSLERNGYTVLLANDGREALEIFMKRSEEIALIVLDLTMPVMSGEEALVLLREIRPDIPIIVSSGYNEVEVVRRFVAKNVTGFIQKPYTSAALKNKITGVLNQEP